MVKFEVYSTGDIYLSSETVFIIEAEVQCKGTKSLSLYALVGDQLMVVARSIGSNQYQLSWSEPHETAKTGRRTIDFYDEEGATAVRKAFRYGEKISATPFFSVDFDHKGLRTGGWFSPSFIAVIVSLLVWWLAYMTKSKLQE